jgi:hypothetical protein
MVATSAMKMMFFPLEREGRQAVRGQDADDQPERRAQECGDDGVVQIPAQVGGAERPLVVGEGDGTGEKACRKIGEVTTGEQRRGKRVEQGKENEEGQDDHHDVAYRVFHW